MKDYLYIGATPGDEPCVQVPYCEKRSLAIAECKQFIQAIRLKLGMEPNGAELRLKWQQHDFGSYVEVVCYYDTDNPLAVDYAFKVESDAPQTWGEVGMLAPTMDSLKGVNNA